MNKNTRKLHTLAFKSAKGGNAEFVMQMPTHNYHNFSEGTFKTRRLVAAKRGNDGVVSQNVARNTQMKVLHNNDGSKTQSLTVHEPISKTTPVTFKNHAYIRKTESGDCLYRQLANVRFQ